MMIKYKVSDVAKDFNVQSKEIIAVLAQHNLPGKKSATALEEHELDIVFEYFTQKHATENLDAYFATANERKKEEPKKEEAVVVMTEEEHAAKTQSAPKTVAGKPVPQKNTGNKPQSAPQPKAEVERRTVDTRKPQQMASNKYDEKFDFMAQTSSHVRGDGSGVKKQISPNHANRIFTKPRSR